MRKIDRQQLNQQGFASIVIALILIIVLALLTVGFAELARREQRNTLDKQLATQAYYAAESGVNDMTYLIKQALANSTNPAYHPSLAELTAAKPDTCLGAPGNTVPNLPTNIIDPTYDVKYSCILLNLQPPSLLKSPLTANSSWNISFSTASSNPPTTSPLQKLTVSWQSVGGKGPRTTGGFDPVSGGASNWKSMAVLQVSITPLAPLDRQDLLNNAYTAYLYPASSGSGSTSYSPNTDVSQAPIVNASGCNASSHTCNVTIDNLNNIGATPVAVGTSYLISITGYYDTSTVSITNAVAADGTQLNFTDGQAQIDVTGKDKDVLKRIQVHIPISAAANTLPAYTLQAQNICKRFDTAPAAAGSNPNGTTYETAPGATPATPFDTYDPCSLNNSLPSN